MGCKVAGSVTEQSVSLIVPPQPNNRTVVSEPCFAMAASHDGTECGNLHAGCVCVLYVSTHLCCSIQMLNFGLACHAKKKGKEIVFS